MAHLPVEEDGHHNRDGLHIGLQVACPIECQVLAHVLHAQIDETDHYELEE